MIKLILSSLKRFAWFKRLEAKVTYGILAKRIPAADWTFMNYGYVPKDGEKSLEIANDPKIQRCPLQMYHYLAAKTVIEGKQVLEVGSGRGGGAKHIAGVYKPASYTGMDLAQHAVDLANKLHTLPNLNFIQGTAESIPLPDSTIDVVINVESCHAYGSVEEFLSEVKRVLKPGGYLLLVDFRNSKENMDIFHAQLRNTGMEWLEQEDIGDNVVRAIEAEDEAKTELIKALVPPRWQKRFSTFAGVVGSRFHLTLKGRTRLYHRFVLRKTA